MDSTSFPGAYGEDHGSEAITWRVLPTTPPFACRAPSYELSTTIRGAEVRGSDLDDPGAGHRG